MYGGKAKYVPIYFDHKGVLEPNNKEHSMGEKLPATYRTMGRAAFIQIHTPIFFYPPFPVPLPGSRGKWSDGAVPRRNGSL